MIMSEKWGRRENEKNHKEPGSNETNPRMKEILLSCQKNCVQIKRTQDIPGSSHGNIFKVGEKKKAGGGERSPRKYPGRKGNNTVEIRRVEYGPNRTAYACCRKGRPVVAQQKRI